MIAIRMMVRVMLMSMLGDPVPPGFVEVEGVRIPKDLETPDGEGVSLFLPLVWILDDMMDVHVEGRRVVHHRQWGHWVDSDYHLPIRPLDLEFLPSPDPEVDHIPGLHPERDPEGPMSPAKYAEVPNKTDRKSWSEDYDADEEKGVDETFGGELDDRPGPLLLLDCDISRAEDLHESREAEEYVGTYDVEEDHVQI